MRLLLLACVVSACTPSRALLRRDEVRAWQATHWRGLTSDEMKQREALIAERDAMGVVAFPVCQASGLMAIGASAATPLIIVGLAVSVIAEAGRPCLKDPIDVERYERAQKIDAELADLERLRVTPR